VLVNRVARVLVVPLVSALVVGCGGGKTVSSDATSHQVSTAQAVAYAHAVNLRAADVPGSIVRGEEDATPRNDLAAGFARCGGGLPGWEASSIRSAIFVTEPAGHFESLWSAIHVAPSSTVAVRDLTADEKPSVRACLARAFGALFASSRGPLVRQSTSVSALPSALRGVKGSFALRMTHRVSLLRANPTPPEHNLTEKIREAEGGPRARVIALDVLGFASGQVEIALTDRHEPGVSPLRTEQRLLSGLYSRANFWRGR
jgi:hypothetical protein